MLVSLTINNEMIWTGSFMTERDCANNWAINLQWHDCLKRSGVKLNNFADFTTAFLKSISPAHNARTATVNLPEVKQQLTENVVEFYACVISIIDKLKLLTAAARRPAAAVMPVQIVWLEGNAALHANVCGVIPTMVDLGITIALIV
jgi:hypothetical protein